MIKPSMNLWGQNQKIPKSTREQLTSTGMTIGNEVTDSKGNHFLRLDTGTDTCLVVRDHKDEKFFLIDLYEKDKADAFLVKVSSK